MDKRIIDGYRKEHKQLAQRYDAIESTKILSQVLDYIPTAPSLIADIGAGTERDADYFSSLDHNVIAVEHMIEFRKSKKAINPTSPIKWVADCLPDLPLGPAPS